MLFLDFVAERLLSNHPVDLSGVKLVFPNIRGGLFLKRTLALKAGRPVWVPETQPMETFVIEASGLRLLPEQSLVWRLYQSFNKIYSSVEEPTPFETFEKFYPWGKLLLSDFDELDRELVPVESFFKSVKDQKEIDDLFAIEWDEEQKAALMQFWSSASKLKEEAHESLLDIWEKLPKIYSDYTQTLLNAGACYAGMAFRKLTNTGFPIERLDDFENVYFAGFVYLSKSEMAILGELSRFDKCRFLWEAPKIIKDNLNYEAYWLFKRIIDHADLGKTIFGNVLETGNDGEAPKAFHIYEATGYSAQAKICGRLTGQWAENGIKDARVGVVVQNPDLAMYALNALPDEVEKVNLTMGYPFKSGLLSSFLELWRKVQNPIYRRIYGQGVESFNAEVLMDFMDHPYTKSWFYHNYEGKIPFPKNRSAYTTWGELFEEVRLPELLESFGAEEFANKVCAHLEKLAENIKPNPEKRTFEDDFFFLAIKQLRELQALVLAEGMTDLTSDWWWASWLNALNWASLPFTGEPVEGIQVMGFLETRNLNFKKLIFLGINEGEIPGIYSGLSFFPFNIRQAYGLETHKKHDAVWAWHFYRLVQSAEEVHFIFNGVNSESKKAEQSRFLWQIEMSGIFNHVPLFHHSMKEDSNELSAKPIEIAKTADIIDSLLNRYLWQTQSDNSKPISASALNTWLDCRLKFYFSQVAKVRKPDEWQTEKSTALEGEVFHFVMHDLYKPLINLGRPLNPSDFLNLEPKIEDLIKKHLMEKAHIARIIGSYILTKEAITQYVKNVIRFDAQRAADDPFEIFQLETEDIYFPIKIRRDDEEITLKALAKMDRVDKTSNGMRIIDYKTGDFKDTGTNGIPEHFDRSSAKGVKEFIQLLFYGEAASVNYPDADNIALEFYKPFNTDVKVKTKLNKETTDTYAPHREEFVNQLQKAMQELLSPENNFTQTANRDKCTYCDYIKICRRDLPEGF